MQQLYLCYASAAFGLEGLVASELRDLKMKNISAENGGVRFSATTDELLICNLHMHFCDRVFVIAAENECITFEDLFQLVYSVPWHEYTEGNEAINVSARCACSKLMSPRDCQSITKKAIIEKIRKERKQSLFPENGPALPVHVTVHNNHVKIMINTSGDALSRRGYRTWNGEAPLRETLAAALVKLSPWEPGKFLYDPCCGTGTILIEAAFMDARRAPGLFRSFAMESLYMFRNLRKEHIRKEAEFSAKKENTEIIRGSDISPEAVNLASRHIRQSRTEQQVHVEVKSLQEVTIPEQNGVFICNPPYGERLSDQKTCRKLYGDLAEMWKRHPSWSICTISSDPAFEKCFGRRADKKRRLYNGRLECTYYIYRPLIRPERS